MKQAKQLAAAIKKLTGGSDIVTATVVAVDKNTNSCDVDYDGNEFGNVRLQSIIKTGMKGVRFYPVIGSKVLIEPMNENGDWMVSMFSEIEEVVNEVGTSVLRINADGHVIKRGTDSLRDVVDDLMGQVKAINLKVQAIVVSPGFGVTPDVAGLAAINLQIDTNRAKAKNILK